MIRIIKGSYGRAMPDGTIQATKPGSAPFKESKAREALLVKQGVAVYVEDLGRQDSEELPTYDPGMKLSELKKVAAAYGVSVDGKKKSEILSDLNAAAKKVDGV